jgi:AcrR family transcriptional regulator
MGDRGGTRRPRRIWRQPDDARREILGAAEKLLSGRSFRELTVDDLMAATGMTRSSFYHYFTGLDELAIALMRRVQGEMMQAVAPWLRDDYEGDPTEGTAHGVLESARVFARHGPVHRAWRHGVVEEWIRANAAQLRTQRDRGLTRVADPEETARAPVDEHRGTRRAARQAAARSSRGGGPDACRGLDAGALPRRNPVGEAEQDSYSSVGPMTKPSRAVPRRSRASSVTSRQRSIRASAT